MATVRITTPASLAGGQRAQMLALMRRYFDGVAREAFVRDLAEKDWVILLADATEGIVGFSTQQLIELCVAGRAVRFLFSGDTIVDRRHRRSPLLAGAFGHLMAKLLLAHGEDPLYWFLISKGPRTYRFLPVFFNDFHPDPLRPEQMRRRYKPLLDAVAAHKFGPRYDPATGVVRGGPAKDRLRPEWQQDAPGGMADDYTRFFDGANPGWRAGDELACIAPVHPSNFNAPNRRVTRATHVAWDPATVPAAG